MEVSFRELIREGAEKGFIHDVKAWFVYREQRNITSQTYDQEKAASVYKTALEFLSDAGKLLAVLQSRQI